MRADAQKNRERIVKAARELFGRYGLAVSMEEIARDADIGMGTLYRHFPDKKALFEAVVLDRLEASILEAREKLHSPDAGEAFFSYMSRLVQEAAKRKDLLDALTRSDIDVQSLTADVSRRLQKAIAKLLRAAQRTGSVRKDVDVEEIMIVLASACRAISLSGVGEERRLKVWHILSDGLRESSRR